MAATTSGRALLECFVCMNDFDEDQHCPHVLSACGHTLCRECIGSIGQEVKGGVAVEFKCPVCRIITRTDGERKHIKNFSVLDQIGKASPLVVAQFKDDGDHQFPMCGKCHREKSVSGCRGCLTTYCDACWRAVHCVGVLARHERLNVMWTTCARE